MRKILSIILITILVLHALGFYGIFLGMYYKNDVAMMRALDAGSYDESQTITIQVALSIPYMPDQADFKRVDGKFVHEGARYRMVKQRYAKDTLTIICVRDVEHQQIDKVLADYVTTFTDNATDNKQTTKINISFQKDYLPATCDIRSLSTGWAAKVIRNTSDGTLIPTYSASITHPPENA